VMRPSLPLKITAVLPITAFALLAIGFFTAHLLWSTGFFLSTFGPVEILPLYGSILYSILIVNTAGVNTFGLKRERRLAVDIVGGLLAMFSTAWLLLAFPFNFGHFAAAAPAPLQFLFSWVSNLMAQTVLFLLLVGSAALTAYFVALEVSFREVA